MHNRETLFPLNIIEDFFLSVDLDVLDYPTNTFRKLIVVVNFDNYNF